MKKSVVLLAAVLFCLSGMARDLGNTWVVTNDGKIDCKKVSMGYNKARIVLENGQKEKVQFSMINSFSSNGKTFDKLPLYKDNKPTNQGAFMELIKNHGELSLYKLAFCDLGYNQITYQYFLYKGNKQYLKLNEKSLANICLYFGVSEDEL